MTVYKRVLRYGWFNIGWLLYRYGTPINSSPESGHGLHRADSSEATHYSQYHPRIPGGRL